MERTEFMTTQEQMAANAEFEKQRSNGQHPIYEIVLIEHANKELVYAKGKRSGFPDTGAVSNVGFYYDLDTAVSSVKENCCDMREQVYDAAFILCRFPGLYETVSSNQRMYFVWNEETKGYVQEEEPKIFSHIAY